MEHLGPDQIATLRARLEQERASLLAPREPEPAPGPPDTGDAQDAPAREADRLSALSLADHERARLHELEEALRRLDDGSYGVCEDSDEPIPYPRLLAEPTARFTVEAQAEREQGRERRDPDALRRAY
jgi:DnaK suppressor protein